MNYYKTMSFKDTFAKVEAIRDYFDSHCKGCACATASEFESYYPDKELDELMVNVLNWFFGCGTPETNWTRGTLHSYLIQSVLGVLGGDLGRTPSWSIKDKWMRLWLLSMCECTWHEDGSTDEELAFNEWLKKCPRNFDYTGNSSDNQLTLHISK